MMANTREAPNDGSSDVPTVVLHTWFSDLAHFFSVMKIVRISFTTDNITVKGPFVRERKIQR